MGWNTDAKLISTLHTYTLAIYKHTFVKNARSLYVMMVQSDHKSDTFVFNGQVIAHHLAILVINNCYGWESGVKVQGFKVHNKLHYETGYTGKMNAEEKQWQTLIEWIHCFRHQFSEFNYCITKPMNPLATVMDRGSKPWLALLFAWFASLAFV